MLSSQGGSENDPALNVCQAYLGLGSSLGDRRAYLQEALHALHHPERQTRVVQVSAIYETPHMGLQAGDERRYPPHLNCVVHLATTLAPLELLHRVQEIEALGNRQRQQRWGPRTIDIDLLLYLDETGHTSQSESCELTLPHPGIALRIFVVVPLLEIAPDITLADGQPVRALLETDVLRAQLIKRDPRNELLI